MKLTKLLSGSLLAAALSAGLAHASQESLTQPTDRESRIMLGNSKHAWSKMRPSEGRTPKAVPGLGKLSKYGTGTGDAGHPGGFDIDGFARFLNTGLKQSYDKTYEQGWRILHTVVQNTLTSMGPLPQGVRLALESGRDASYDRSWQDGYKVLHEAVRSLAQAPGDFAGDPQSAFSAYVRLARQSAYEKSYEVGWKIVEKYLDNLEKNGRALIPNNQVALALKAGRQASYGQTWQAGWEVLHVLVQRLESVPGGDLRGFYYQLALESSYNKSYEQGYKILRAYIEQAIGSNMLSSFDRASLQTTLQASYNQTWQAGYEVLRDGLKALLQ